MVDNNSSDLRNVILIQTIGAKQGYPFRLFKRITLPFVPAKEIRLGLMRDSWIDEGLEPAIEQIVYLSRSDEFVLKLKAFFEERQADERFWKWLKRFYLEEGWALFLRFGSQTPEGTYADVEQYIVQVRGAYYAIYEEEVRVLELSGEDYCVIRKPSSD